MPYAASLTGLALRAALPAPSATEMSAGGPTASVGPTTDQGLVDGEPMFNDPNDAFVALKRPYTGGGKKEAAGGDLTCAALCR